MWVCVTPQEHQEDILRPSDTDLAMVCLGWETYFGLDKDGTTWWGNNLPKGLHNKLWGRQSSLPVVEYIALDASTKDHYYVSFVDKNAQWCGPDSLSKELKHGFSEELQPGIVCFAPDDGW